MNGHTPDTLTVIFRDDGPMICCGDSPSYRTVRVRLTEEQREALTPQTRYTANSVPIMEEISRAIVEKAGEEGP